MIEKKILIIVPGFKHGGTNRSLYNLLSIIDKDKYSIDVFGMSPKGFYSDLFENNKILIRGFLFSALMSNLKDEIFIKKALFAFIKMIVKIMSFFKIDVKKYIYEITAKKNQFSQYDSIIAFQEGEATLFASKIKCKNKIAWIHCNYAEYLKYLKKGPEIDIYNNFNSIVCVSNYTKKVFSELIPELSNRVYKIHNALNVESVKSQSLNTDLSEVFKNNVFNIISVGRLDIFKRFSVIPEIIFKLKNKGLVFKWFLIGGISHVEEEQNLLNNIQKYNVQDYFNYIGEVDNPYPYIAKSNLLVSTSLSEAFPYVLIEAKALGTPVLVTNFGSAEECVIQGVEGIITPIEEMHDELEKLINDKVLYDSIRYNLQNFDYDNDLILKEFDNIL